MRAATREEFNKASEWRIYDYVTRHFIGSLHDDMEYTEKTLLVDVNGYQFQYTWHEVCFSIVYNPCFLQIILHWKTRCRWCIKIIKALAVLKSFSYLCSLQTSWECFSAFLYIIFISLESPMGNAQYWKHKHIQKHQVLGLFTGFL